jgi:hypothetical protein
VPALILVLDQGQWWARVANTRISYPFVGATVDAQSTSMISFAQAMVDAGEVGMPIETDMGGYLALPQGVTSQTAYEQIFEGCDQIIYAGDPIYSSVDFLDEELDTAGEALLDALGALA